MVTFLLDLKALIDEIIKIAKLAKITIKAEIVKIA